MKKYTTVALSLAVLLMTSGCGTDDSDNGGGDTTQKTKYEGTWAPSDGMTITLNGSTLKIAGNGTENDVMSTVRGTGSFSIDGTKKIQPNDKTVDKITHSIVTCSTTLTPLTDNVTIALNADGTCDGGWVVNVAKDTSDCIFPGDSKTVCEDMKEASKTIFYLDGNKIHTGDDEQSHDADGYPNVLGSDIWTKK